MTEKEIQESFKVKSLEEFKDGVRNPSHYTQQDIECLDAIKASMGTYDYKGYLKGNVIKYLWRFENKNGLEDLCKADYYLELLTDVVYEEYKKSQKECADFWRNRDDYQPEDDEEDKEDDASLVSICDDVSLFSFGEDDSDESDKSHKTDVTVETNETDSETDNTDETDVTFVINGYGSSETFLDYLKRQEQEKLEEPKTISEFLLNISKKPERMRSLLSRFNVNADEETEDSFMEHPVGKFNNFKDLITYIAQGDDDLKGFLIFLLSIDTNLFGYFVDEIRKVILDKEDEDSYELIED